MPLLPHVGVPRHVPLFMQQESEADKARPVRPRRRSLAAPSPASQDDESLDTSLNNSPKSVRSNEFGFEETLGSSTDFYGGIADRNVNPNDPIPCLKALFAYLPVAGGYCSWLRSSRVRLLSNRFTRCQFPDANCGFVPGNDCTAPKFSFCIDFVVAPPPSPRGAQPFTSHHHSCGTG